MSSLRNTLFYRLLDQEEAKKQQQLAMQQQAAAQFLGNNNRAVEASAETQTRNEGLAQALGQGAAELGQPEPQMSTQRLQEYAKAGGMVGQVRTQDKQAALAAKQAALDNLLMRAGIVKPKGMNEADMLRAQAAMVAALASRKNADTRFSFAANSEKNKPFDLRVNWARGEAQRLSKLAGEYRKSGMFNPTLNKRAAQVEKLAQFSSELAFEEASLKEQGKSLTEVKNLLAPKMQRAASELGLSAQELNEIMNTEDPAPTQDGGTNVDQDQLDTLRQMLIDEDL